ncbi:hypothetical protein JCM9279_006298 [Rhodotorula babjevae]
MYLRAPRIFMFLLTQSLVAVEVGLSSWSLAYGYEKKHKAAKVLPGAKLDLMDAFAVGGTVTAAAGLSSILCGILLLYTVFHPRKPETLKTIRVKEALFGTVAFLLLAALIPATVITATRSGVITAPGIPPAIIATLVASTGEDLRYRKQTPIVSYLIVGWIAWLSTIITGILVSIAARKTHKYGVDQSGTLATAHHGHHDGAHVHHGAAMSERERSLGENDSAVLNSTTTAEKGQVQHVDHDHQWSRA